MSRAEPNRSLRARLEVLAEELEDAAAEAIDTGDLVHATELWVASATVWGAAEQLGSFRDA